MSSALADHRLPPPPPQTIAVVGSGISGLACAYGLAAHHRVTLFEADTRLGGHSHTIDVSLEGKTHPVDTGFLVFNHRTYPQLTALLAHLSVDTVPSDMSLSVRVDSINLEWAGTNLSTVFGQKRQLINPQFWYMLRDILRFNRTARAFEAAHAHASLTLGDFIQSQNYSHSLVHWYLLPMAAAIWSNSSAEILNMPLSLFVRFADNHGLLSLTNRPLWYTVADGSRTYVNKIANSLNDVRLACRVHAIEREGAQWRVRHEQGEEHFSQVVLACHSDQALNVLGHSASDLQRHILASVRYQNNTAMVHTSTHLLPHRLALWSAWNYWIDETSSHSLHQAVSVSYLINRLQPLPFKTPVVVSLNPTREPAPEHLLATIHYAHPILDGAAHRAQALLPQVQGENGIWLAGAWTRYGFHEDGLRSATAVINGFGHTPIWQRD